MTHEREADHSHISRKMVAPGWAEMRIVIPMPPGDEDEFSVDGRPAGVATIKWVLSYAAGIAFGSGFFQLEGQLYRLWTQVAEIAGLAEPERAHVFRSTVPPPKRDGGL